MRAVSTELSSASTPVGGGPFNSMLEAQALLFNVYGWRLIMAKEAAGNSWDILIGILVHGYNTNHSKSHIKRIKTRTGSKK